jgi:hypothetical protein
MSPLRKALAVLRDFRSSYVTLNVLALDASYIQSRLFRFPPRGGDGESPRRYMAALKRSSPLYLLVAIVLAVAAIYEAIIAIVVFPHLR